MVFTQQATHKTNLQNKTQINWMKKKENNKITKTNSEIQITQTRNKPLQRKRKLTITTSTRDNYKTIITRLFALNSHLVHFILLYFIWLFSAGAF